MIFSDVNVYLINLDRSPMRLASVTDQLNSRRIPFERVTAFDASKEDLSRCAVDKHSFQRVHGRSIIRNAELGCHQSHVQALTRFVQSNKPFAVILEDDIEISSAFESVVSQLLKWKADWDIVPLFHWHRGTPIRINSEGEIALSVFLTAVTSSAAYIVNRHAAKVLLTHMLVQKACVDHELFDIRSHHLRLRGVTPRVIELSDAATVSTIGASGEDKSLKPSLWRRFPTLRYRSGFALYRLFKGLIDGFSR
jgi:glycosyl transferase, family 25